MIKLQGPSRIITHDETVTVIRDDKIDYIDGKPYKKKTETFELTCNVQPFRGLELLIVPEGDRTKEQYWLWTNKSDKPLTQNDRIVRNGVNFQVQTVEDWGSYQKARIMRIDVGPNTTPIGPNATATGN